MLRARVSSNLAALINSGCPPGRNMTCLHLLGEALAYLANILLAGARHFKLGSKQHSGRVSTEKTSALGQDSSMDMAQPLLVSAMAETLPQETGTSRKCPNDCVIGFSPLLSRTING